MKTSMREIIVFDEAQASYRARQKANTKLTYAIDRIIAQVKNINKTFNETVDEEIDKIRIDHCLTDPPDSPNGKVLRNDKGGYEFTREKELIVKTKMREARNTALDRKDLEINPHFVKLVPDDLTIEELQGLSGFVIDPKQSDDLIAAKEPEEDIPGNGFIAEVEREHATI